MSAPGAQPAFPDATAPDATTLGAIAEGTRSLPGHPRALFGRGLAAWLPAALDQLGTQRCLVVRGGTAYQRCGVAPHVSHAARGRVVAYTRAWGYQTTLAAAAAAAAVAARFAVDTVVGVGGGSALDLAKAAAVLPASGEAELTALVRAGSPIRRSRRLVLLPTTAGSGSELTPFATLWDGFDKLSLDSPELSADIVLVDPDLLSSVPGPVAVSAAADALCQAAESYWAVAGTAQSREWAAAAYRELLAAIGVGCGRGTLTVPDLQERMAWGAALAGTAIAVSRTTAAHALSYPLTSRLGLPHGAAALLQLPWLARHNGAATAADCRLEGGPERLSALTGDLAGWSRSLAGADLAELARRLLRLGGYPADHADLPAGPWQDDWLAMTRSPRMTNNPRTVTRADVRALLDLRRSPGHG